MILPYFSDYCLYSHYLLMGYELMGVREGFDATKLRAHKKGTYTPRRSNVSAQVVSHTTVLTPSVRASPVLDP